MAAKAKPQYEVNQPSRLETLENIILIAKKHRVDIIELDGIKIIITKHEQVLRDEPTSDTPIKIEVDDSISEEDLLYMSVED